MLPGSGRAWAQEFGQPVQWMRTFLGMSSCSSSLLTIAIARFFVSMMATPQNCAARTTDVTINACKVGDVASAGLFVYTYMRNTRYLRAWQCKNCRQAGKMHSRAKTQKVELPCVSGALGTHLSTSARHQAAREVPGVDGVLLKDGLLAQSAHASLGDVGEDDVLLNCQPDSAIAIPAPSDTLLSLEGHLILFAATGCFTLKTHVRHSMLCAFIAGCLLSHTSHAHSTYPSHTCGFPP